MKNQYDVIIIGGGPSGLSAALTLARGRRNILIFDDQNPRNIRAKHMQNFPSHDGLSPTEFKKLVIDDLKRYPNVHFENARVDNLKIENNFKVTANNKEFYARKIMLAHGMRDLMLPIPGFEQLWGRSIFQCPYCHGYELQNLPLGLVGGAMMAKHMTPILKGLTDDLVLFTDGEKIEDKEIIEKNGVKIYEEKIVELQALGESLKAVKLSNGTIVERNYLFLKVPQIFTTDIATKIGCAVTEHGFYVVDEMYKTTVNGIYAAGDIVTMRQSVLGACATGQMAGATINHELLSEDFS